MRSVPHQHLIIREATNGFVLESIGPSEHRITAGGGVVGDKNYVGRDVDEIVEQFRCFVNDFIDASIGMAEGDKNGHGTQHEPVKDIG